MRIILISTLIVAGLIHFGESCSKCPPDPCNKCKLCWDYKPCFANKKMKSCWKVNRRYYIAAAPKLVSAGKIWGSDTCTVFNPCDERKCGCAGLHICTATCDKLTGIFFAYDRKLQIQYSRLFHAKGHCGDFWIYFANAAKWTVTVPVTKEYCGPCGKEIETVLIPKDTWVEVFVHFKFKIIVVKRHCKYMILLFCAGLNGLVADQPFFVVVTTMQQPAKKLWMKIMKDLWCFKVDTKQYYFFSHKYCTYPPVKNSCNCDWKPNPDCDIC